MTSAPTASRAPAVRVWETTLSIPTYPYANYLVSEPAGESGIPFQRLDWTAYKSSYPQPVAVTYRAIVVESDLLQVTLLPELGGRIYRIVAQATGHNVLYNNPVIKPTRWGPAEQGWWLAVGGIEFCLPVEEHGYETALPWSYAVESKGDAVTVRVWDSEQEGRLRASVAATLRDGVAGLTLGFQLENGTARDLDIKYWTNAMVAPGGHNRVTDQVRFCVPAGEIIVHSSGDETLPGSGERLSWPSWGGRDLSVMSSWGGWLGFFASPGATHPYAGVFDVAVDEGLVRVFPPDVARGVKGFGMGPTGHALPPSLWTDDGSTYVELHGGLAPTFDATYHLPAAGSVQWEETWFPVSGLGGLMLAGPSGAASFHWDAPSATLVLRLLPIRPLAGQVLVTLDGATLPATEAAASAGHLQTWRFPLQAQPAYNTPVEITLASAEGEPERWSGWYRP